MAGSLVKCAIAAIAGAVSVLGFAPFDWWFLLLPGLATLFLLWFTAAPLQAFLIGLCFGFGQFGAGVSWVYISIQTFGGMPPVLAAICVAGFVFYISLYPAFAGLIQSLFRRWRFTARVAIIMPVSFVGFEWLRGWVLTGFPWLNTGYSVIDTPLVGLAPIGGVYLVGLIAVFTIGVIIALVRDFSVGTVGLGLLATAIWVGGWYSDQLPWTGAEGKPIRTAIIQNNVPLDNKWDPIKREAIIAEYLEISQLHRNKDLVVWPEGAIPDYLENLPDPFWDLLRRHPADFAFGALYRPQPGGDYYNSIAAVSETSSVYSKRRLVPFGEFFPMKTLLAPILEYLTIPMSNFSSWPEPQPPLPLAGSFAAASICYEDAFPQVWRNQVARSGFLLNVSEDMWFGNSLGPHQRLQMARFRAREAERPMVRSSNNGLSSLIDWRGEVVVIAPQFEKAQIVGSIQPRGGITPFVRYGDYPALILGGSLLLLGLLFGRRRLR